MTNILPPLLPVGAPSTTPPKPLVAQRPLACKLSLSIPIPAPNTSSSAASNTATLNCGQTPATRAANYVADTPVRQSRPKLSLSVASATTPKPSLSLSLPTSIPEQRESTPELDEQDETTRNTIANQRLTSEAVAECMDIDGAEPTYNACTIPGVKPILKHGLRSASTSSASSASSLESMDYSMSMASSVTSISSTFSLAKSVSFDMCPSYIPRAYLDDEDDEEELVFDVGCSSDENMSPPSTTSSTDSEESESDNECKTPVDENKNSGWMTRKFAGKPGYGGSGRWKKAKREWVWTLGDLNTQVGQTSTGYNDSISNVWVAV